MLRIIVLLALMLLPAAVHAEARIALLIGNQGYNVKVGPLKNPLNDIALIGATLEKLGFKVTLIKDADYKAIDTGIKRHVQAVRREGQGTISFVYYSGHGAADPDTKINYLIPVDVANADDEDLWTNSLNLNNVVEGLRAQAPGATHYVVFDACRNELNLTRKGQKALADKGFVPIAYTPGVMIAYATAPGRTASDTGSGAGVYARTLADELVKPGVDSMLVFTRVARRVLREIGQDPFLSASTMPEVYFAGEASNSNLVQTPQGQPQLSDAERTWALVKDATDPSVLEAFTKQFGETIYGAMARARIDALKKQQLAIAAPSGATPTPKQVKIPVNTFFKRLMPTQSLVSKGELVGATVLDRNGRQLGTVEALIVEQGQSIGILFNHGGKLVGLRIKSPNVSIDANQRSVRVTAEDAAAILNALEAYQERAGDSVKQ